VEEEVLVVVEKEDEDIETGRGHQCGCRNILSWL